MGTVNLPFPASNSGDNDWSDVYSNDKAIVDVVNGGIANANLSGSAAITDANLASPNNSAYRTLSQGTGSYVGSGSGTKYFVHGTTLSASVATAVGLVLLHFDNADYAVGSKTQKLRVRAQHVTSGTAPAVTLTVGMYPVTAVSSGAFTVGSVVSGSTVAFASTAKDTLATSNSGDFTIPSDGYYIFGVANSGTTSGASDLFFQLQTRSV